MDFDGQFAMAFASGATLIGTYSGNLVLLETGLYAPQGDLILTGGTGEFADASGSFGFVSYADSATGSIDRQTGQATRLWLSGYIVP
jgi:hypothetical protein